MVGNIKGLKVKRDLVTLQMCSSSGARANLYPKDLLQVAQNVEKLQKVEICLEVTGKVQFQKVVAFSPLSVGQPGEEKR